MCQTHFVFLCISGSGLAFRVDETRAGVTVYLACAQKLAGARGRAWGSLHSPLPIPPGPLQQKAVWGIYTFSNFPKITDYVVD